MVHWNALSKEHTFSSPLLISLHPRSPNPPPRQKRHKLNCGFVEDPLKLYKTTSPGVFWDACVKRTLPIYSYQWSLIWMYALLGLVAAESRLYLIMLNIEWGSWFTGRVQAERVSSWSDLMVGFGLLQAPRETLQRSVHHLYQIHISIKKYFLLNNVALF